MYIFIAHRFTRNISSILPFLRESKRFSRPENRPWRSCGRNEGGKGMAKRKSTLFPLPFSPSFFDSSIPRFPELALRSRAPTNTSSSEPCKAVRGREDRRKKGGGQRHPCNHQHLTHSFHPCFPPCFSSSLRALILLPAHTRCRERERDIWAYTGEGMRENIRKLSTAERPLLLEADNFTWIRGCFERNCTVT